MPGRIVAAVYIHGDENDTNSFTAAFAHKLRDGLMGSSMTTTTTTTRMVQLPATAAIEYVAACWVSGAGGIFVPGCFCPGGLLPGGTFVRGLMPIPPKFNAYAHRLGFLCLAS